MEILTISRALQTKPITTAVFVSGLKDFPSNYARAFSVTSVSEE